MSRLDYAPKLKEIEITDIKRGLGVFAPKADKPVSFAALKEALKKAGYSLDSAEVVVAGRLEREGKSWSLVSPHSGQRFALEGAGLDKLLEAHAPGERIEVTGGWKTEGERASAREVIAPREVKKAEDKDSPAAPVAAGLLRSRTVRFVAASYGDSPPGPAPGPEAGESVPEPAAPLAAPIRATSPGLTVFRGGAFTPRFYLIRQHLGDLDVWRQVLDLSISYTPTPRLQLEAEVPVSRTSYDDGRRSGSGAGIGNVTLWGKYRFYRSVKTYGDRQASARFGLELPTGKTGAPGAGELNAPAFVREQLSAVSGGLSPRFDLSASQAGGRFIVGGNVEAVIRSERGGFRTGHEIRVNTDTEYVLLPREYRAPGRELFVILETTFVHRGRGRTGGSKVAGSGSTEFYLSPGLQFTAAPQFVIEGSLQLPVVMNAGPLSLRTDANLLLGVRYLF